MQRLLRLLRRNLYGSRKTGHQITSSHVHVVHLGTLERGAYLYLQILCRPFTDQQIMFFTHITHDSFVEIIARYLNGSADHRAAEGNHRDIGSTAADIHNHVSTGLGNVNACADGCRNRLLNDGNLSGARLISRILHGFLFHFGHAAGHADCNARLPESLFTQSFLNKILHHFFRNLIVGDNALPQGSHRHDITRRSAEHKARVLTDCLNFIRVPVKSDNGGLLQYNTLTSDIY